MRVAGFLFCACSTFTYLQHQEGYILFHRSASAIKVIALFWRVSFFFFETDVSGVAAWYVELMAAHAPRLIFTASFYPLDVTREKKRWHKNFASASLLELCLYKCVTESLKYRHPAVLLCDRSAAAEGVAANLIVLWSEADGKPILFFCSTSRDPAAKPLSSDSVHTTDRHTHFTQTEVRTMND